VTPLYEHRYIHWDLKGKATRNKPIRKTTEMADCISQGHAHSHSLFSSFRNNKQKKQAEKTRQIKGTKTEKNRESAETQNTSQSDH